MARVKNFNHPLAALVAVAVFSCIANAAEPTNPLDDLAWIVSGEWKSGSTVQVFEWGLEKRTIKASSYVISGDTRVLASEGFWYWHPEDKVIKGIFTAEGMPFYLIESEAKFEGKKFIHRLKTYSENNKSQDYIEVIEPESGNVFMWRLFPGGALNDKPLMADTFKRSL